MALTVISLGFGSRSGSAGVVTLGFGLSGATPAPVIVNPSGGYAELPSRKRRTKEDIRAERVAYGILKAPEAAKAIHKVAESVLEAKETPLKLNDSEQLAMVRALLTSKELIAKTNENVRTQILKAIADEVAQIEEDNAIVRLLLDL